jgi:hypothetical protein
MASYRILTLDAKVILINLFFNSLYRLLTMLAGSAKLKCAPRFTSVHYVRLDQRKARPERQNR